MRTLLLLLLLGLPLCAQTQAQAKAQTSPWDGTFKLDPTRSHLLSEPQPNATLTIATTPDGTTTWTYSGTATITGQPDGTPQPVTGAYIPPGDAISFRKISARRIDFITSRNTKLRTIGYLQLSPDGQSIDDVNWLPTDPIAKEIKVYVRQ